MVILATIQIELVLRLSQLSSDRAKIVEEEIFGRSFEPLISLNLVTFYFAVT